MIGYWGYNVESGSTSAVCVQEGGGGGGGVSYQAHIRDQIQTFFVVIKSIDYGHWLAIEVSL